MIPTRFDRLGLVRNDAPLTLRAEQANSTVTLNATGSPTVSGLKYRTRSTGWQSYTVGTTVTLAAAGDYVQFWNTANTLSVSVSTHVQFSLTGTISAHGNAMSMLNFSDTVSYGGFFGLFWGCTALLTAPKLPATVLSTSCYQNMFRGCTGLTDAPQLPAAIMAENCYVNMFSGCTSLIEPPALPARTLARACYYVMFFECNHLVAMPDLPATNLEPSCYRQMFAGCINLSGVSSALPATTLADNCYRQMFQNCYHITTSPAIAAKTLAENSCISMFSGCSRLQSVEVDLVSWDNANSQTWLYNVAASGTFTCPSGLVIPSRDANGVPAGWTIVTQ